MYYEIIKDIGHPECKIVGKRIKMQCSIYDACTSIKFIFHYCEATL